MTHAPGPFSHAASQNPQDFFPIWAVRDSFDGEICCRARPMSQPRDDRQDDLFRPLLEEIINLRHPLVRLAGTLQLGVSGGTRAAAVADAAGGRAVHCQAYAQPLRRGAVRAMGKWCSGTSYRLIARRSRAGASGWVRSRSPRCCRRASRRPTAPGRSTPKISNGLR